MATSITPECAKANPPCPITPQRRNFKLGEVITGEMYTSNAVKYQNFLIPLSVLRQDSSIDIDSIITTKRGIDTNGNPEQKSSDAKNFFTPKNIIIGAVVLFGILKLTRVM